MAYVNGDPVQYLVTLYNERGAFDPVPCDDKGRSISLGGHLRKLEPGTVFYMVAEEVRTLDGGVIPRTDGNHRVIFSGSHPEGEWGITVSPIDTVDPATLTLHPVSRDEISRAFTLAADYWLTADALKGTY